VRRGAAAGLAAGIVASAAMNGFQFLWNTFAPRRDPPRDSASAEDDTTVKAASAVSEGILRHRLSTDEKRIGGTLVHYAFGGAVGALYGALAERDPRVTTGHGVPFGVVFWLVADEMAVPALGLSRPATSYPVSVHLYALLSHLVFGASAEKTRRLLRPRP
jgi:uncharacterized membrane protein YagU involved in acid resistance